jgi:hypothetical protein
MQSIVGKSRKSDYLLEESTLLMPCFCLAYALLKASQKQGISKSKARQK